MNASRRPSQRSLDLQISPLEHGYQLLCTSVELAYLLPWRHNATETDLHKTRLGFQKQLICEVFPEPESYVPSFVPHLNRI